MKKLFFFLAVTSTALFTSCSSDDDSTTTPPVVVVEGVTAIDLTSDIPTTTLGGSFTFTVKDQDGNILPTATLTVNGAAIANPWTPTAVGSYTVNAAFETFTDTVTVTVTEVPQTVNTFAVDGTEYTVDLSSLVYLGTNANNTNFWVADSFILDENEEIVNEAYVIITNTQVNEQYLDLPTAGNFAFGETVPGSVDAGVIYYNTTTGETVEYTDTELVQNINFNLASMTVPATQGDPQNWNYTYEITLTSGTVIKGNFNGDWGFVDASTAGRPAKKANTAKKVVRLSNTQIKQNRVNFLKK